jgi:hypothetical protein
MADERKTRGPNPAVSNPRPGTTRQKDFGRTDRYDNKDNKDEPGSHVRNAADGAQDEDPDDPSSDVNRDE